VANGCVGYLAEGRCGCCDKGRGLFPSRVAREKKITLVITASLSRPYWAPFMREDEDAAVLAKFATLRERVSLWR
jgi:hypothetical protein